MNYLVVGNGPSASSKVVGSLIDAFDGKVVRFNQCAFFQDGKDLRPFIGSRIDIWATCGWIQTRNIGQSQDLLAAPKDLRASTAGDWERLVAQGNNPEHISWETYNRVSQEMGSLPSSGALTTAHLLERGNKVFLYGFDFMARSQPHHYWSTSVSKNDVHCASKEKKWFTDRLKDPDVDVHLWDPDESGHLVEMYRQLYASEQANDYKSYSKSLYFDSLSRLCGEVRPATILDYGCGYSDLCQAVAGPARLIQYDPAIPEFSDKPTEPVDILVTTDVLEHIPVRSIAPILDYPARYHFHAICCRPAVKILNDGSNAHCTVKTEDWWEGYLTAHFAPRGKKVTRMKSPTQKVGVFVVSPESPLVDK